MYTRAPEHDRRIGRGDDYAADAWRDNDTGQIVRVTVGHMPKAADPDDGPPPPWDSPVLVAGYSSGDLDLPAIGRKLARLERSNLTAYLASTPRRFWPMLARAYATAIEPTEADRPETAAGMIWLWSRLVTWHQAGPSR